MTCDPEKVTGFMDGELDAETTAAIGRHLPGCEACRSQVEAERAVRARLRALPEPELPPLLEARLRARVRRRPSLAAHAWWALPLAAAVVAGFWVRGHAPLVAWELARDHDHCFSRPRLPARVWSDEPAVVGDWFARQGTRLPPVPAAAGGLALVGARYCPMPDASFAPHVYYASETDRVSVFLVPHAVRLEVRFAAVTRGRPVRLVRVGDDVVGIVGERETDVEAFETALRPAVVATWGR